MGVSHALFYFNISDAGSGLLSVVKYGWTTRMGAERMVKKRERQNDRTAEEAETGIKKRNQEEKSRREIKKRNQAERIRDDDAEGLEKASWVGCQ